MRIVEFIWKYWPTAAQVRRLADQNADYRQQIIDLQRPILQARIRNQRRRIAELEARQMQLIWQKSRYVARLRKRVAELEARVAELEARQ